MDYLVQLAKNRGINDIEKFNEFRTVLEDRARSLLGLARSLHEADGTYWPIEELQLTDSPEDIWVLWAMKQQGLETYAGISYRL